MIKLDKWVGSRKYKTDNAGECAEIQTMLFSLGCGWQGKNGTDQQKHHLDGTYIYVNEGGMIGWSDNEAYFQAHAFLETTYGDLFKQYAKKFTIDNTEFEPVKLDSRIII